VASENSKNKAFEQVGAPRIAKGGIPQKYFLDEHGRKIIISGYRNNRSLNSIARELRVPAQKVSQWAVQLGVSRHSSKRWSEKDIAYLKRNFYKKDIGELAVRLKRPANSVSTKAYQLGLSENNAYNKYQIAEGLGVHPNTVSEWIAKGWLKGKKRGNSPNDHWEFLDKDIRKFVLTYPHEVNPKKFDWLWVADILSGGEGMGRLDENYEKTQEDPRISVGRASHDR
jgi:DNA-directed RNA polymerase specialized sigma subunit